MESNYSAMVEMMAQDNQIEEVVIDESLNELVGFGCVQTEDREVEYLVERPGYDMGDLGQPVFVKVLWDDGSAVSDPWFTQSGNNPIIRDRAALNDCMVRLLNEEQPPLKSFYSAAKVSKWGNGKIQERNMHKVVGFVKKNKDNPRLLRKGWVVFWQRVYAQTAHSFMFPSQIKLCRKYFEQHGIKAVSKK